ncbi:MAG: hypothetical protein FGM41_07025 [Bacteroidetes bacterium]|nr:hypothetical protein [Bacteroidota bacterium]
MLKHIIIILIGISALCVNKKAIGQKTATGKIELKKSPYKVINDTPYVRIQQYRNDTLIQEMYCFAVPTCRISYGFKKLELFKKYHAIEALIPHGRYVQYEGVISRTRVYDHGVLIKETYNAVTAEQLANRCCSQLEDIKIYDYKRKCNRNERRYNYVLFD